MVHLGHLKTPFVISSMSAIKKKLVQILIAQLHQCLEYQKVKKVKQQSKGKGSK